MSEIEFEELNDAYVSGRISRRRFINRLIGTGVSMTAALAVVSSTSAAAAPGQGALYGALYGTPPGQGGTPPGQGGTPPPFAESPPGQGGTPPGQGGTPPGQQLKLRRRG